MTIDNKLTEEQIELVKKFSDCRKRIMKLCITFPDSMILTEMQRLDLEGLTGEAEDIAFELSCSLEKSFLETKPKKSFIEKKRGKGCWLSCSECEKTDFCSTFKGQE